MGLAAAIVALLLLTSAVLTAVHDAVFQITRSHTRTLVDEGFDGADNIDRARERKHAVQASVRVTTAALDLSALAVIALTGVSTWGRSGPVVSTIIGVVIVLMVADLIPHLIAARRPVRLALSTAGMLLVVERLARPLVRPVERLEDRIGGNDDSMTDAQRELREIQEIGEEEGVLEEEEKLLVERAFRLDELTAWDVMVPRVDTFAWKEQRTLADIVEELADVPYSRVPVYRDSVDDVTGIVYVREIYERFASGERDLKLVDLARDPFFVPGSRSLTELLQEFQARRIHMGIVADEFGGTDGLVTLEDILEELVGEIRDETDVEEEEITRISDDVVECDAGTDLRDLVQVLGITLPQGEHRSLNGLLLEELGHVPEAGERLVTTGVRIDVLEASDTQVLRARVTRTDDSAEAESA
ncbi:MAG: hemolysin family protein [Gemmatimonadota bacterium]|nr:hemolysin family protein [Gemmatimonadota bacterium]MDE3007056.1 hemolysin family protein [Gemmatimonadota bacterium]MDE3013027.1 hemolysin family protein [Gemmatimonadota bacterium]